MSDQCFCKQCTAQPDDTILAADEKKADYHGPKNYNDSEYVPHKAVHDVTEHLLNGRVTNPQARRGLRDALDKADAAPLPAGTRKSDGALGRATRFGVQPLGLIVR